MLTISVDNLKNTKKLINSNLIALMYYIDEINKNLLKNPLKQFAKK